MKINAKVTLFVSTLLLLSSCTFDVTFFPYSGHIENTDTYSRIDYETYFKPGGYVKDYIDVLKSNKHPSSKIIPLRPKGEQRILVLPVTFAEYPLSRIDKKEGENARAQLQNAFFGENRLTSWRSVSGFYHESSYGKIKITGEVAPWFTLPSYYTINGLKTSAINSSTKLNETQKITNLALLAYQNAFPDRLSHFDQDEDGIIDSVYVIYANPYDTNDSNNIFWAFAANMNRTEAGLTHQANAYSWSSYHYMHLDHHNKPDAHTYIHEVAHLLGISDYYNTNYEDTYAPLGGFDMMDYTLGDHTGLTKMLLNWSRPFIPLESGTIKLRPFSETGELILLKNNWNGNATDEYLLLEYYTPTALNELDSTLNTAFKLPRKNGVKIYHVDARTAYEIKEGSITRYYYVDEYPLPVTGLEVESLAHSNSSGRQNSAPKKDNLLYRLLEPKESTNISEKHNLANIYSLFSEGQDFGIEYFTNFVFNDGTPFNYKVKIEALSASYATINVEVLEV